MTEQEMADIIVECLKVEYENQFSQVISFADLPSETSVSGLVIQTSLLERFNIFVVKTPVQIL